MKVHFTWGSTIDPLGVGANHEKKNNGRHVKSKIQNNQSKSKNVWRISRKMQLDVDIEPTLRFPHMTSIDKQMDKSEGSVPMYMVVYIKI